jgi:tetratricopeptide (TPR) repeat protein
MFESKQSIKEPGFSAACLEDQNTATWSLAWCYDFMGEPGRTQAVWPKLVEAMPIRFAPNGAADGSFGHARTLPIGVLGGNRIGMFETTKDNALALNNYGMMLFALGRLADAEKVLAECAAIDKHSVHKANLGNLLCLRGDFGAAEALLIKAMKTFNLHGIFHQPADFAPPKAMFFHLLRTKNLDECRKPARGTMGLAATTDIAQIRIDAFRMLGYSLMADGNYHEAETTFAIAFTAAREIGSASEIFISIALAELYRLARTPDKSRELLADLWEPLQRGPLPLRHAEACNILAEIELNAGLLPAAIDVARVAYGLAWCDGPPYCYAEALEQARSLLVRCGTEVPFGSIEDKQ